MNKRLALFLAFFAFVLTTVSAQVGAVRGTVVSADDGEPVVGATVTVRHAKKNAVTDLDGKFQINDVRLGQDRLIISYIGMKTVEVAAKAELRVRLEAEASAMDEVIVVAFGKQKRESFTGSAAVLDSKQIAQQQVSNPISALSGRVAGLQMAESNSATGYPSMNVRGVSSINAAIEPLIVLDGLPYNGAYSDINPADVESMTVLKDAASTALYGARGANGVILITTKQAKRGQAVVTMEARVGANTNARVDYETIDQAPEYYEAYYRAHYNANIAAGQDPFTAHKNANNTLGKGADVGGLGFVTWTAPEGQYLIGENGRFNPNATKGALVTNNGKTYLLMPEDWKKAALRNGIREEYNVNVNGGNDTFQAYANMGYMRDQGLVVGTDYERYTGRMKFDWNVKPWLRVGTNVTYTHGDADYSGDALSAIYSLPNNLYPIYVRDAEGNILQDARGDVYDWGDGRITGVQRANLNSDAPMQSDRLDISSRSSNAFGGQAYAEITFLTDFRLTANVNIYETEYRDKTGNNPYYGYATTSGGGLTVEHNRYYNFNTQQLLNWAHTYGQHTISALLGHEYSRDNTLKLQANKTNYFSYATHQELNGLLQNGTGIASSSALYNVEGFFLRAQYDYASKYFASASYRRDGSSRFHPDHRWGNFWSVGGAWIVTKEKWELPRWVSMLKLKASYGQQGNDGIGNFNYSDYYDISVVNGEGVLAFDSKGKQDITWETNTNLNVGLEFELFNHRLRGSVEYYNRKTTDMLMWFTVPTSMGYSGYYDNIGDMSNRGVELTLDGDIVKTRHFTWGAYLNMSFNKNEVSYLPEENKTSFIDGVGGYYYGNWQYVGEGKPIYTWWLKKWAGLNEQGQSIWYRNATAADGVATMETTTDYDNADYYLCGDPHPTVYGGLGMNFQLYGFDLSVNCNYSLGGKDLDGGYASLIAAPVSGATAVRLHKDILRSWTPENTATDMPRWQYGDQYEASTSDRFLVSASYFTLKSISAGYTFPKQWIKRLGLTNLRVYASADNIAYWTARKGFDPRNSLAGSTVSGAEPTSVGTFPKRAISGGIQVQF